MGGVGDNMMRQLSGIISQHSVKEQRSAVSGQPSAEERSSKKAEHEKVAKEMESLFAYQLLKIMRKTANGLSTEKKGNDHDTYMSLFDMEISKLFAERGLGLQDAIIKWLDRLPEQSDQTGNGNGEEY
jgi:Rod binding domain-containing protein